MPGGPAETTRQGAGGSRGPRCGELASAEPGRGASAKQAAGAAKSDGDGAWVGQGHKATLRKEGCAQKGTAASWARRGGGELGSGGGELVEETGVTHYPTIYRD